MSSWGLAMLSSYPFDSAEVIFSNNSKSSHVNRNETTTIDEPPITKVCTRPFRAIEIYHTGDVFTCCPAFLNCNVCGNANRIGNIFENSADEIWNSDKAVELRKAVLRGDYSKCNLKLCRQRELRNIRDFDSSLTPEFPSEVVFAYDRECNLACITCRDELYRNPQDTIDLLDSRIEPVIMPFISNAKRIAIDGSGEIFASKHSRLLLKKITNKYPNIRFLVNSNGILCTKKNVEELGLSGKINEIFVSIPALDEKIYKSIVVGGNLKIVLKNLKWLASEMKCGNIDIVTISLVVSALNYKEIPKIVDLAKNWTYILP